MRPARPLFCALLLSSLAHALVAARRTLREAGLQGWSELELDWLVWQHWRAQHPWKLAAAAAALGFVLGIVVEWISSRRPGGPRSIRLVTHPAPALVAALLAFALPPALAATLRPKAPPGSPNLLFVLIDTWRADHAGFLGYERPVSPRLDALSEEGVVFENALAQSGWTKPSVATLLTGLLPSEHRAISQPQLGLRVRGINLPPRATTLVELFAARGWETGMWSNNPNILPERGFAQGADHFVDYFHQRREGFDAGRSEHMLPDVERWLEARSSSERPFCAYVHVMDPHYPYVAPPPFAGTFAAELAEGETGFQLEGELIQEYRRGEKDLGAITPSMVQRLLDIYDEELLYVDHYVGGFLERVFEDHPDTVVVVVGDHGEEFLEHGQLGHSHSLYRELTHVPLVLWAPTLEAGRVASQVRLFDVLPTLLELTGLGAHVPAGVRGESLLPLARGEETGHRLAPMETGGDQRPAWHWRAISDGETKLLRREADLPTANPLPPLSARDLDGVRPYDLLFDLSVDPFETRDLAARRADEVERLFRAMRERGWYFPPEDTLQLPAVESGIDEGDIDTLEDLGYAVR